MAPYRKIHCQIWNDAKFRTMSDDGQLSFLFVLTHPHMTSIGAMRATVEGLASERGWLPGRLRKAFGEAVSKGMLKHDNDACFVVAPNFVKWNKPESPNVVKSWVAGFDTLPECRLKWELLQRLTEFTETLSVGFRKAFREAFAEALAKGMPNQEQEQELEQQQEQELELEKLSSSPDGDGVGDSMKAQFEVWWKAYPKRVGKAKAFTAWKKAREATASHDEPAAFLLERATTFAASPAGQAGQFTPHPTTSLNEGRYDDDENDWNKPRETGNGRQNANLGPGQITQADLDAGW